MKCKLAVLGLVLLACPITSVCRQTETIPQEPIYPTLQPPPGRITFTSTRDNGIGTIYVVNSDGTGLTRVTPPEWVVGFPRWAPGCDRIAFSASDGIYVVNPDGSGLSRLVELPYPALTTWSPDGKQIAFRMPDETLSHGGTNVWVMNSDGTRVKQLTHCTVCCGSPVWHPDGESIFYFSYENFFTSSPNRTTLNSTDPQGTIHEIWLSASEMTDIPFGGMRSISPDGARFVLVKEMDEEEHTDVFTLSIETKEWSRLTDDQAYYDQPAWSPDGQQIVYVNYRVPSDTATRRFPSVCGLWIMNTDGSARFQVVVPEGKNTEPDWCAP